MADEPAIRRFYEGWQVYNERMIEAVRRLTPEQLALRASPEHWPLWAIVAHVAGVRTYWLCTVLGEPGVETTPFTDPEGMGWEDDLEHPRSPDELVFALETTWSIVERCLNGWTVDMLDERFERAMPGQLQIHTRQSVLLRLLSHDAYHCGELSQTLGVHGLPEIYLWKPVEVIPQPAR